MSGRTARVCRTAAARWRTASRCIAENCAACHGANGQGGIKDRLVGGQGTLASDKPIKTVGSFWPYATTLFDYIHRAMPYQAPGSLSVDDTYAVAAYILSLNGILPADGKLDKETLPKIKMPNRDGFIPDPEFKLIMSRTPRLNAARGDERLSVPGDTQQGRRARSSLALCPAACAQPSARGNTSTRISSPRPTSGPPQGSARYLSIIRPSASTT